MAIRPQFAHRQVGGRFGSFINLVGQDGCSSEEQGKEDFYVVSAPDFVSMTLSSTRLAEPRTGNTFLSDNAMPRCASIS